MTKSTPTVSFQLKLFESRLCYYKKHYIIADNLRAKCVETVQNYFTEAFDCGKIGRIEVLPLSLNSIDILKMKDMYENSCQGKSNEYQDIIMKTAFYCNHEFYQVKIFLHVIVLEVNYSFSYRKY